MTSATGEKNISSYFFTVPYMKMEVTNMRLLVNSFLQRLEYAALQDDEKIVAEEAAAIKRIRKASIKFIKDLDRAF